MLRVKLFTSSGGFVVEGMIPPFNQYPDVLVWGQRIFQFERAIPEGEKNSWGRYLEAFSFYVLPQFEVHNGKELEKLPNRNKELIENREKKKK